MVHLHTRRQTHATITVLRRNRWKYSMNYTRRLYASAVEQLVAQLCCIILLGKVVPKLQDVHAAWGGRSADAARPFAYYRDPRVVHTA